MTNGLCGNVPSIPNNVINTETFTLRLSSVGPLAHSHRSLNLKLPQVSSLQEGLLVQVPE